MVRGIVYSFLAVSLFLLCSIILMTMGVLEVESADLAGGWLLMVCFFGVGPLFFLLGYWHHWRLNPKGPHWDPELEE
ncbi:MAG: hypothetical protein ACO3ZW_03960 [Opitutales bacterium]|jgi:hypothetical protein